MKIIPVVKVSFEHRPEINDHGHWEYEVSITGYDADDSTFHEGSLCFAATQSPGEGFLARVMRKDIRNGYSFALIEEVGFTADPQPETHE